MLLLWGETADVVTVDRAAIEEELDVDEATVSCAVSAQPGCPARGRYLTNEPVLTSACSKRAAVTPDL